MNFPVWTKPVVWGAILGSIATMAVGFSTMGWSTARTTEKIADNRASVAVAAALVPFCLAKAEADPDPAHMEKMRAADSSYSRSAAVRAAGWATLAGMTGPDYAVAEGCSTGLQKLASK